MEASRKKDVPKYIAFVRYRSCNGMPSDDKLFWRVIESAYVPKVTKQTLLKEEYHYSFDCDYLGGPSYCEKCGVWIQKLEPYTKRRAIDIKLENFFRNLKESLGSLFRN